MQKHKALTSAERHALKHFRTRLESSLAGNLVSLRLFGSRARGEGTDESDLDVLVVLWRKDRAICRRIVEEALETDLVYDTNLAPIILSAEEYQQNKEYRTPFYRNVERESLPLQNF
jgi:predicted nucleotidyltransferase